MRCQIKDHCTRWELMVLTVMYSHRVRIGWHADGRELRLIVSFSGLKDVTSGVPQGSVLGSQLFTVYMNSLEEGAECSVPRFADDINIGRNKYCDEYIKKSARGYG